MPTQSEKVIIKLPRVKEKTALSRSSIYAKIKEGSFPQQIRLGARAIGFIESEIDAWIHARIESSRNTAKGGGA